MSLSLQQSIEVLEKVYIRSGKSGSYQCYFRYDNQQYRKSLKTHNFNTAKKRAVEYYHSVLEDRHIVSFKKVSFIELCERYISQINEDTKRKYHEEIIRYHFKPYFGHIIDIKGLKTRDVMDFIEFRQNRSRVKNQTINRQTTVLRQMLRFANDYGWIDDTPKVPFLSEKQTRSRRYHFSEEQLDLLLKTSKQRSEATTNIYPIHLNYRILLHNVIVFMIATGMRVDELKTVRWEQIDFDNRVIRLRSAGKLKTNRKVIVGSYKDYDGMNALKAQYNARVSYLKKRGLKLALNERVFILNTGICVESIGKGFKRLVKECEFKQGKDYADRYTLTSLRHSYLLVHHSSLAF